jgi:nitroreductase
MPDSAGAELRPRAEELADVLRGRRSINLFEPDPVGIEVLMEAIEVARWAPNHRLTEPWRFYVIGEKTKRAIAESAADFEAETKGERVGAARLKRLAAIPAYFVVTARRGDDPLLDREDYAATCCAVQNLMLYLWQRGVGVKWTTGAITREQRFYDLLGIDRNAETVVGFFWYGRAKVVPEQSRKDVAEIVVKLD